MRVDLRTIEELEIKQNFEIISEIQIKLFVKIKSLAKINNSKYKTEFQNQSKTFSKKGCYK